MMTSSLSDVADMVKMRWLIYRGAVMNSVRTLELDRVYKLICEEDRLALYALLFIAPLVLLYQTPYRSGVTSELLPEQPRLGPLEVAELHVSADMLLDSLM